MTIFFTADHHFFHKNIIKYCARPYSSIEEMNQSLIENWNKIVSSDDEVYHLGDFCFGDMGMVSSIRQQLSGKIHLIWGNHDSNQVRSYKGWESSNPYKEITLNKQKIVLFHYGCRVWNGSSHGSLMLYGHSHGKLMGNSQSMDVGVDNCGFTPIDLDYIREKLQYLPKFN